jgi:hypothetical protein
MLTSEAVSALGSLAISADAHRQALSALHVQVQAARRAGASWSMIGAMLGITKQAAAARFTPRAATRGDSAPPLF